MRGMMNLVEVAGAMRGATDAEVAMLLDEIINAAFNRGRSRSPHTATATGLDCWDFIFLVRQWNGSRKLINDALQAQEVAPGGPGHTVQDMPAGLE